jgi:hypothetical protein
MILRTRPALRSAASPVSPLPALLLTMVSSFAPCAIRASMSSAGSRGAEAAQQYGRAVARIRDRPGEKKFLVDHN